MRCFQFSLPIWIYDMTTSFPITLRNIITQFGTKRIHDGVNLDVHPNEILGLIGASGSGKSVLLRTMIGLLRPWSGNVCVLGENIYDIPQKKFNAIRAEWGVSFQSGALFSSQTVAQNIQIPMREHLNLSKTMMDDLAALKISLVGLSADASDKYPSELSGGMRKRVGVARALSLDPQILLLDEPTAGLDAIGAENFDRLIKTLQKSLGLTVIIVTHDIDTLVSICDRVAALVDKKLIIGTIEELIRTEHPWINEYFGGMRGRQALRESGQYK
jgi:phospholipid/cholesterol/gamma-HCH transport system ATP-binding protein